MYLLFVLIQCLLVVFVNGDVDEPRYDIDFEGGHSFNDSYVMQENGTITVTVETPQVNDYKITWKIIDKQGNPINFKSETIILPNNVVQFQMWTKIPKNVESIQWFWIDSSSNQIGKTHFKQVRVKEELGTEIEVTSDGGIWGNGQNFVMENKIIEANCKGDRSKDTQLDWVDTSGNLLIPSERIQISMIKINRFDWFYKSLHLNVTTDMEGVGC